MSKTALITGATSGIGRATAIVFARQGFRLILCGRRTERLEELSQSLGSMTDVKTLSFDVRIQPDVQAAIGGLPDEWKTVDILVNNAGNAHGLAPIQEGVLEDWDAMIDINVKGLLYVSKAVIPLMLARKQGHIINIGSIAGKEVYPNGNVYCASKHAVDALNNAMRMDLNGKGIKVSSVNPGLVNTEFSLVRFKGDEDRAKKVYEGLEALRPEDVAEVILFTVTRPAHVNVSDLILLPAAQASSTLVSRQN